MFLPNKVVQNDLTEWQVKLSNPLESGTILKYYFAPINIPNTGVTVEPSEVVGSEYKYAYTFSEVGRFYYQLKTVGVNTKTLVEGILEVAPDLSSATEPIDLRSPTQKLLDTVEEAIAARVAGGSVKEYEIAGRRLNRYSLEELLALRSQLQREVALAARAKKLAKGLDRNIYVRFAPPHY